MSIEIISLVAVVIALLLMMYLAYKGMSLLLVGPIVSALVLLISGMNVMDGLQDIFSQSMGNFVISNFLIFVTASLFGSILGESGAASDIAYALTNQIDKIQRGNKKMITLMVLTVVFVVLTYGGVSAFVIVFTMVPLCKRILKKYDIPWHFYMAIHSLGANLFTNTMIPGSPAVQNLIPIEYLGTTPMAAPWMGIATAIYSIILSVIYIYWCLRRSEKQHEGFMKTGFRINETILAEDEESKIQTHGSGLKAVVAPIIVLVTMNAFGLTASAALALGVITCMVLYWKRFENVLKSLSTGTLNGAKTLLVVASIVGFGGIVTAIPGYQMIIDGIDKIPGSPLIQLVLAVNIVAAITGSASGGESIAFEAFGEKFASMGFPPEVIHRVAAIACQGLDSLPHGGSIINQLETAKLTHKEGYMHIFVIAAVIPFTAGFFAVLCYYLGIV